MSTSGLQVASRGWISITMCCIYDAVAVVLTVFKIGFLQRKERKGVPMLTL